MTTRRRDRLTATIELVDISSRGSHEQLDHPPGGTQAGDDGPMIRIAQFPFRCGGRPVSSRSLDGFEGLPVRGHGAAGIPPSQQRCLVLPTD